MKFIDSILKTMTLLALLLVSGCIAEDYSDCQIGVIFNLSYTLNQDNQNKFDQQVESVSLFIYDEHGTFIRVVQCNPANHTIKIDDLPGGKTYKAVFWANDTDAFYTLDRTANLDTHTLTLNGDGNNEIQNFSGTLFHNYIPFEIHNYGIRTVQVPLVKNTNRVTIKLKNATGFPVTGDYRVTISGSNAVYKYDNSLVASQPSIIYYPIAHTDTAGEYTYELNIGRMFFGDDLHVDIAKGGTTLERIPLVATLAQHSSLLQTDLDLDRYDEYELEYSLGKDDTIFLTFIRINEWQNVIQNGGIY